MATYSIEARSLAVAGVASHNFWVLRDQNGRALAELHGLATNRETGQPVPIGTDPSKFSLRVWHYPHDRAYAASLGVPADAASYIQEGQFSTTVLKGRPEEVLARWNAAVSAKEPLNALDINYPMMGVNLAGGTVNSNSAYRTLGEIMGVAIVRVPQKIEPGVGNRMVTPESIERLRTHGYPALERPSTSSGGVYTPISFERSPVDRPTSSGAAEFAQQQLQNRQDRQDRQDPLHDQALRQLAPAFAAQGQGAEQAERIAAGLVRHSAEHAHLGAPTQFLLSNDGSRVLVRHGEFLMSEMGVAAATAQPAQQHMGAVAQGAGALSPTDALAAESARNASASPLLTPQEPTRSRG